MKKKGRQNEKGFDGEFDNGKAVIDFSKGIINEGLSKFVKLPPIDIPAWLAAEIQKLAKIQGNSRASIIRQLLTFAIEERLKKAS